MEVKQSRNKEVCRKAKCPHLICYQGRTRVFIECELVMALCFCKTKRESDYVYCPIPIGCLHGNAQLLSDYYTTAALTCECGRCSLENNYIQGKTNE